MRTFAFSTTGAVDFARLITITRGARVVRFSDVRKTITIDAVSWLPVKACTVGAMQFRRDGEVANATIYLAADSTDTIKPVDVILGVYDGADILIEMCNQENPSAGKTVLLQGAIGKVSANRDGVITLEARGLLTRSRGLVTERYSPMCRADLGDDRCKIPLLPSDVARNTAYVLGTPKNYKRVDQGWMRVRTASAGDPTDYANLVWECTTAGTTAGSLPGGYTGATLGTTVTDGTAHFTARDSFTRSAVIASVSDNHTVVLSSLDEPRSAAAGWFTLGTLLIRSGPNAGIAIPISNSAGTTGSQTLKFFMDITPWIAGGESVEVCKGCDKTEATCLGTFDNIVNRRAETFVPGRDLSLASV